jgi:hypothetical protein
MFSSSGLDLAEVPQRCMLLEQDYRSSLSKTTLKSALQFIVVNVCLTSLLPISDWTSLKR